MKIKKIRIKNYKSIVDTGDCWWEDTLTIFAGKNESGKTSILEALEDFNVGKKIQDSSKPISNDELIPEISIVFVSNEESINQYYKNIGLSKTVTGSIELEITKVYPDIYSFSDATKVALELDDTNYQELERDIKSAINLDYAILQKNHDKYFKQHGWGFFVLNLETLTKLRAQIASYRTNYTNSYMNQIPDQQAREINLKSLQEIEKNIKVYEELLKLKESRWDIILDLIPNFILFKSFEDNIPNEVDFEDLKDVDVIKDLELIGSLNTELILSEDTRKNQKHKESLNITLNKEYSQYWSQDATSIKIEWDSEKLFIWILEEDEWYLPSQRSKGKQWHMSFYIRISARSIEDKVNIILIDEPGMFLHASAQKDIYSKLLECSSDAQIAFTTHSPYLIDSKELHRVRLVTKINTTEGTKVVNKIHAKSDKETLTPILTAIGLELNQGIQNVNQMNNIVVEGPADVFYLNKMATLLKIEGYNFVFGGGSGNMGNIGTILNGWGCNVIYLFDNDQGKKDGIKNLTKSWHIDKRLIISISEDIGAIEDLFSKEDFKKLILKDADIDYAESNSIFLKTNKIDKVLLSKQFISSGTIEGKNFSKETIAAYKKLFDDIKRVFNNDVSDRVTAAAPN